MTHIKGGKSIYYELVESSLRGRSLVTAKPLERVMTTGSRKELTGLLTLCGNEELLEREETRRSRDALFRAEVVGSNPAGPTIKR